MLHSHGLLQGDSITVSDVDCRHGRGAGEPELYAGPHALVFVRRGCFVRHADGEATTLDPTLAYGVAPGEEQRYDHPGAEGDRCTAIFLAEPVLASITGGEPALPDRPVPTGPQLDLQHRRLLAAARRGRDRHAVIEGALELTARTVGQRSPERVAAGRPRTARVRRQLADDAREALTLDPDRSLVELARGLAVSPHHLSRVFRAETGETVARHRLRLRARTVLERLAGGERDLARLALESGFADQSHLCRVMRSQTGRTPGALRNVLGP